MVADPPKVTASGADIVDPQLVCIVVEQINLCMRASFPLMSFNSIVLTPLPWSLKVVGSMELCSHGNNTYSSDARAVALLHVLHTQRTQHSFNMFSRAY